MIVQPMILPFTAAAVAVAAPLLWMVPATLLMDANLTLFLYDCFGASHRQRDNFFANKCIWITGASSGIGAELARQLYQHGADLVLSSRNEESLLQQKKQLLLKNNNKNIGSKKNNSVHVLPFDVTANSDNLMELTDHAYSLMDGKIDIVILNAGLGQLSTAESSKEESNRQVMEVNYWGPVRLAQSILSSSSRMQENRQQQNDKIHLVLTSSVASKMAIPLSSTYAASKHAVDGYFKSLRTECEDNVRIDMACPGPIETNFQKNIPNSSKGNDPTKSNDNSSSDSKMPVERCVQLMLASMMGPAWLMQETWISRQPTLLFTYLAQYAPGFSNLLVGQIGKLRLRAYRSNLPLYELSTWFKVAFSKEYQNGK